MSSKHLNAYPGDVFIELPVLNEHVSKSLRLKRLLRPRVVPPTCLRRQSIWHTITHLFWEVEGWWLQLISMCMTEYREHNINSKRNLIPSPKNKEIPLNLYTWYCDTNQAGIVYCTVRAIMINTFYISMHKMWARNWYAHVTTRPRKGHFLYRDLPSSNILDDLLIKKMLTMWD